MIIEFHTPSGIVTIDTATVTDADLVPLGLTMDDLNQEFGLLDVARALEILATSPDAIAQPEIWELVRIFGRRLGFYL